MIYIEKNYFVVSRNRIYFYKWYFSLLKKTIAHTLDKELNKLLNKKLCFLVYRKLPENLIQI